MNKERRKRIMLDFLKLLLVFLLIFISLPIAIIGGIIFVKGIKTFLLWMIIMAVYLKFMLLLAEKYYN